MRSVSLFMRHLCLRRLVILISRSPVRICITSHKTHISDMKETYFEKAVCKAKHTFIPAHMIISMIYNLKGKSWILSKIGCFLPEMLQVFGRPGEMLQVWKRSISCKGVALRPGSWKELVSHFITDKENCAWNPPRQPWPQRVCLGWMGKGTPLRCWNKTHCPGLLSGLVWQ